MEFDFLAMLLLFLVIIFVGIALVSYFGTEIKSGVPNQLKGVYDQFTKVVFQRLPYNVCDAYNNERVSVQDFQILVQAVYSGQCGINKTARVIMSFSVSKDDMQKIASLAGIASNGKLIFYNMSEPIGIGAVLVRANAGFYPLKLDDEIELSLVGQPKGDLFIKLLVQGCDPFDDDCDQTCIYRRICDPICDDGKKHDIPCNLACIDINKNNTVDVEDAGKRVGVNKCNPDCYVNYTNPYKAYDPGCVWKFKAQNDDVCDPNSNGIIDGVCDPDCPNTKNICDFDCNGQISDGNPYGLSDDKCYKCDETCNGWCSPACDKDADEGILGYDSDCKREKNSKFFCSGDGFCDANRGESCANSADCPGGGVTCSDYNPSNACCPQTSDADYAGCSPTQGLKEGDSCVCGTQCNTNLLCDPTGHCCPAGKEWDGTTCKVKNVWDVVFVPINYGTSDADFQSFQALTQVAYNDFTAKSPFKECAAKGINLKDKIAVHLISNKDCTAGCGGANCCLDQIMGCVDNSEFRTKWDKIVAISNSGPLYEPQYGIRYLGCGPFQAAVGGPASITIASYIGPTSTHEIGHTLGLCHECGLDGSNRYSDCPNPDVTDQRYVMCYGSQQFFSSASYNFIRDNTLNEWVKECV